MAEEIKAFLDEIAAVYKKHGLAISHEDNHGAFGIVENQPEMEDWLRHASDWRPESDDPRPAEQIMAAKRQDMEAVNHFAWKRNYTDKLIDGPVKCLGEAHGNSYALYWGDCVDVSRQLPSESIGFSVMSVPFSNLFVYSDSECDMGNSADDDEFFIHYGFLIRELFRLTQPGRLSAVHCSDLPKTMWKDGMIAIKDLSGSIIRAHEDAGWMLHSRITIWKSPVVEMTRTKALGLLYKQLRKDSGRSRAGMPDYLLVFRKPGDNAKPITHDPDDFPVSQWQEWASPVWMTVDQTNVLNAAVARSEADEKHLCPLQLDVIHRALTLWSAPGDTVLSPFMGIGSEGVESVRMGRKFVGIELKEAYFKQAVAHIDAKDRQESLQFG